MSIPVRLTGYYPFYVSNQMEGGKNDRAGHPLHTLEDAQSGAAPFCSVSGDDAIWPYGQKIAIDAWPDVTFRVVDTGSHFRGAACTTPGQKNCKEIRTLGEEPLDVCVATPNTHVPTHASVEIVDDKGVRLDLLQSASGPVSAWDWPTVAVVVLLATTALLGVFAWA